MRQAPCPHFLDAFSDFVDDRLSPERRMELQAHLDSCEACLKHLAAYRRGVMVYRALDAERIERYETGALFEDVERRLWLEGHLGSAADDEPDAGPARPGIGFRALGLAAAAALAFLVIGPQMPPEAIPSDDGAAPPAIEAGFSIPSDGPVRVASVPIEIPSDVEAAPAAPRRAAGDRAPVRVASIGTMEPADLAVERRLAEIESRLRRLAWETPVSVTDGWSRPRIGGVPTVRTVSYTPARPVPARAEVPAPWSVEAALVVP